MTALLLLERSRGDRSAGGINAAAARGWLSLDQRGFTSWLGVEQAAMQQYEEMRAVRGELRSVLGIWVSFVGCGG